MKTTLITIFCFCTLMVFGQAKRDLPPSKPGACYAKCLLGDEYQTSEIELRVYKGDPYDTLIKREMKEVVLKEGRSGWEKKIADRNCLSPNPSDCLVTCYVDIPEEKIYRLVVVGEAPDSTFTIEKFNKKVLVKKVLVKKGGFIEWKEVVCERKINQRLVRSLQNSLFEAGYLDEKYLKKKKAKFNTATKSALKEYQSENSLPLGNLDFETLAHLGIDY